MNGCKNCEFLYEEIAELKERQMHEGVHVCDSVKIIESLRAKLEKAKEALERSTGTYSDPMQERERAMMVRKALAELERK